MRGEINARDVIIARLEAEPNNLIPGLKENNDAIANLELKLSGVISELKDQETLITELGDELSKANLKLEAKDRAITAIKSGLAVKGGDKQLPLFPPELTPIQTPEPEPIPTPELTPIPTPEPTPTPTPELKTKTKSKANPKAKSNPVPEIDLASLIIPPGYKVGGSAELIEFVIENFPNSELKTKGNITDAIRDRDSKKEGSDFSRLVNYEQECGFKHLGKVGAKHQFLIPIA